MALLNCRFSKKQTKKNRFCLNLGFTLVELLVTIVVIGILASIAIVSITNAARDSSVRLAEQQQAVLQTALTAWIAQRSNEVGLIETRTEYNNLLQAGTNQVFNTIKVYLDPKIQNYFQANATAVSSEALSRAGRVLQFTTWNATETPYVQQQNR